MMSRLWDDDCTPPSAKPVFVYAHGDPGHPTPPAGYRTAQLLSLWKMSHDEREVEFQRELTLEVECFTTKQVFPPRWTELDVARNVEPSHPCKLEGVYEQWALQMERDMSIRHAAAVYYGKPAPARGSGVEGRAAKRRAIQVTTASWGTQTVSPPIPERMRETAVSEGKRARD